MATQVPRFEQEVKSDPFLHVLKKLGIPVPPRIVIKLIALGLDYLCIFAGTLAGLLCYQLYHGTPWPGAKDLLFALTIQYWLIFVFLARAYHLYSQSHSMLQVLDTAHILRISCYAFTALSAEIYIGKLVVPRITLCFGWLAAVFLLLIQKHFSRWLFVRVAAVNSDRRKVLILGTGRDARRIFSCLQHSPDLGLIPVSFVDEINLDGPDVIYSHDYVRRLHAPVLYRRLTAELCTELGVSEVLIAETEISQHRMAELTALARASEMNVSFVGSAQPLSTGRQASMRILDGLIVMSYAGAKSEWRLYQAIKRAFDFVAAILLLLATSPIWAIVAIWVKRSSKGPIFFRQVRVGQNGKKFGMYKFRSMYVDAPKYSASPDDPNDPRITSAGRILRKTSLDELPQILNVLTGDMSLVGPRPEMPYIVDAYDSIERQRLNVPQGITGLWQLSADRKYAIHESLEYDLYYIDNRGFFLDLAILAHTFLFAAKGI